MYHLLNLHSLEQFREVVALEQAIWGYTDTSDIVTLPVFIITVKRGAILLGAADETGRLVGFAYSIVGLKDGRPIQWSHMTGVIASLQGSGLGYRLKVAQRERAMALGYELIEWTFDPLQAMNAHFNFAKLGVVADEYLDNVYGESSSALHRGTPTDRLVAQWRLRQPHVERRLGASASLRVRDRDAVDAPSINETVTAGAWRRNDGMNLDLETRRVWMEIPTGFTGMQRDEPELALAWRMESRQMFHAYFQRGYRVVDFLLDRASGRGRYLLAAT
jgi:predicted GNAT superfamily acetyltransferase